MGDEGELKWRVEEGQIDDEEKPEGKKSLGCVSGIEEWKGDLMTGLNWREEEKEGFMRRQFGETELEK